MLELKLNHVSKRGPWWFVLSLTHSQSYFEVVASFNLQISGVIIKFAATLKCYNVALVDRVRKIYCLFLPDNEKGVVCLWQPKQK